MVVVRPDHRDGLLHAGRAQGHRLDAGAQGPNRVNLLWIRERRSVRRRVQAHVQGDRDSGRCQRLPVPPGPVPGHDPGARHLGGHSAVSGGRVREHRTRACSTCWRSPSIGRVRHHPGGMGRQLEVRVPGRHALRGADRRVRNRHGFRHGRRAHGRPAASTSGDIIGAQRGGALSLELVLAVPSAHRVFHLGRRRDHRAPFDVAEGESEIVAGFHVGLFGDGVRAVLHRRVRQHDPDLGAHRGVLLRRLAVAAGRLSPGHEWLGGPSFFWLGLKTLFPMFSFL